MRIERKNKKLVSKGTFKNIEIFQNADDNKIQYKDTNGNVIEILDDKSSSFIAAQLDIITNTNDIAAISSPSYIEVDITAANITSMNASPIGVIHAQGAGTAIEFISAVLIYDYDTAQFAFGGDITIEYSGGATISTTISAANSFGAVGDKVYSMAVLNTAGGFTIPVNTALALTSTGEFTNPGTAAGVGRLHITYRVHTTGL